MRTLEQNVKLAIADFNDIKAAIEEKISILEEEFGEEASYLRPQLKGTNTYANIIRNFSVGRLESHIINDVTFNLTNISDERLQNVMHNEDRLLIKDGALQSSEYSGEADYSLWFTYSGSSAYLNVEGGTLNDKAFVSRDVEVILPTSELRPEETSTESLYSGVKDEDLPLLLKAMASGNELTSNGDIVSSSYAPEDYHMYNTKDNKYYSEDLTETFDKVLRGAYPSIVRRNEITNNLETINKIDSDEAFYANISGWGSFNNDYEFTNENPEILYFGPYFSEDKNEYKLPDDNRVYAVTTDAVKDLGKPTIDDSICSDDEEVREALIHGNHPLYDVSKNAYYYITGNDAYNDGYDKGKEDGHRNGLEEGYYSGIAAGKPVHQQIEANNYLSSYYGSYSGAESDMYKDLYIWTAPTGEEGSPVGGIVQDNVTVKDVKDYFAVKNVDNSTYLDSQMSGFTLYDAETNTNYQNIAASDLVPYPYSDSYQGSYSSEDYCLFNINANRYYATVTAKTCYYSGYEAATPIVSDNSVCSDDYYDLHPYDPETNTYYANTTLYDIYSAGYEAGTPVYTGAEPDSNDLYKYNLYDVSTNTYFEKTANEVYEDGRQYGYHSGYDDGQPDYDDSTIDNSNSDLNNYNLYNASTNTYYYTKASEIYDDAYQAGREKGYYSGYADAKPIEKTNPAEYADKLSGCLLYESTSRYLYTNISAADVYQKGYDAATPNENSNVIEYSDGLSGCLLYDKESNTLYTKIDAEDVYSKGYNSAKPTQSSDTISGNNSSLVIYNANDNVYYALTGADVYNAGYAAGLAAAQEANANNEPEGN